MDLLPLRDRVSCEGRCQEVGEGEPNSTAVRSSERRASQAESVQVSAYDIGDGT